MKVPKAPPDLNTILQDPQQFLEAVLLVQQPDLDLEDPYLHWDELRRRDPIPGTPREFLWAAMKIKRRGSSILLPFPGPHALRPHLVRTGPMLADLAWLDQNCAGHLTSAVGQLSHGDQQRFVLTALREEAIQSSLLEGAATTRVQAKELLRTMRRPVTQGERMVANNHAGIEWIRERLTAEFTPASLRELHAVMTEGTLEDPDDAGRTQAPGEVRVTVRDNSTGDVVYQPPPAARIPEQLEALCAFANGADAKPWIHPVERAIISHFWMGWLHPFVDGNGRTARALFYWVMLRNGYWFLEYVTLSKVLREAPAQYARSYLLTETDGNDVTYFVLHQLQMLRRAVDQARAYVTRKVSELRDTERSLGAKGLFNPRQLALLRHALQHETTAEYTFKSHQNSHGVAYPTARTDLLELAEHGLLRTRKRGRAFVFVPVDGLPIAISDLKIL